MSSEESQENLKIEWDKEELFNAYKRAAEYDDFLFGDHDYSYIWMEEKNKS